MTVKASMAGPQIETPRLTNGAGVAAVLAAGLGGFAMAVLAIIADHSTGFKKLMIFYTPTGPLSGVTTTAIVLWLACWLAIDVAWKRHNVGNWAIAMGLCLIGISFILMFPPISDLF